MRSTAQTETMEQPITLTKIVPAVRTLPALDKLRLIRILAEQLESDKDIFPFESGKTYHLPTPYSSYGATDILAEAMVTYQEENDWMNFFMEFDVCFYRSQLEFEVKPKGSKPG